MTWPVLSILARTTACVCALALLFVLGIGVLSAGAVGLTPEAENFIPRFSEQGSGAGQLLLPEGVAIASATGDLYVAEEANHRISEFSPWGNFIRAFGWGVADGTSKELQTCATTCFRGLEGAGAGEFESPVDVAVDSSGNLYVRELEASSDKRVQKFSPSGQFLLMFGGEVNETQVHKREEQEAKAEPVTVTAEEEDVCAAGSGDQCGDGSAGSGPGRFSAGSGIALLTDGTVAIGDKERIEEFEPDGAYKSEVPLAGKTVKQLAVDPTTGDFYVTFTGSEENLYRLSPTGDSLGGFLLPDVGVLATDLAGNVYVSSNDNRKIVEFDPSGKKIAEFDDPTQRPGEAGVFGLGTNAIGDLYVTNFASNTTPQTSFLSAYGPGPVVYEPPPKVAPTIESEYATSAELDTAVVKAQINPHFWSDTTYYVQYGTADCAVSACASKPAAPGSKLAGSAVDESVTSGGVLLSGLVSDTTYHYRFVAVSSGGGPVFGADRTFTTFPELMASADCPNQLFRIGFSASLADCRAYEMVSPVDKDNGDVIARLDVSSFETGVFQSAIGGERFTYSSYRSFGEVRGAPYTSQYMANRDPASGWSSEAISPAQRAQGGLNNINFENEYSAFSADLSSAWLAVPDEPVLTSGGVEGIRTLYRRDDGSGDFEALTTVAPPNAGHNYEPELQGVSSDGSHIAFRANGPLTSNASSEEGIDQVYESYGGGSLRLVSVLPDGTASSHDSSVGFLNGRGVPLNHASNVSHALSDDGSRVYWSETNVTGAPGKIYVRENADQEQSALNGSECVEPDKACTVVVSSKASEFQAASADGSKALYRIAEGARTGELDEFDLEEGTSVPVAEKVEGLLGASEDLSYVYFVAPEVLAPGAKAGQPNLYVRHQEAISFIASATSFGLEDRPIERQTRVTPDGRHIAFISSSSLTGYDNVDAVTGKPDIEVYTYDADSGQLDCVSCDRTGARPTGQEVPDIGGNLHATAALIPAWETELYASRALSDDGERLFFNSYTALVPRDTNGKEDVYEWEMAGSGDCDTANPAFGSLNGGCVSLISSGESPDDSGFVDASPSGNDVFFTTSASLLPQDPGLIDVYDARVDGGFPAPVSVPASCEGEACQGAPVSPSDQTPASASFDGPGDLVSTFTGAATPKRTTGQSKKASSRARSIALSKALRACRTKARHRKSCEADARKRYGAKAKSKAGKSARGRGRRS